MPKQYFASPISLETLSSSHHPIQRVQLLYPYSGWGNWVSVRCNNLTTVHSQKVPELRFEIVTVLPKHNHLRNSLFKSWVNTHVEKSSLYKHEVQWHVANTCVDTNQLQEEKMSSTPEVPCAPSQLQCSSSSSEIPSLWPPTSSWVCLPPNVM